MSARAPLKAKPKPAPKAMPHAGRPAAAAILRLADGQMLTAKDLPAGIVPVAMGRVALSAIQTDSPGGQASARRWSAIAYSGGVFGQWFSDRCIIDLDTMRLPDGPIPTRLTHQECYEPWDPDKSTRIGFTDQIKRTARGIETGGGFLNNALSDRVVADGSDGYPWQVSIIAFGRWEIVPEGASVLVNGVEMTGGSCILRDSDLRAVDYVELGADVHNQILQLAQLAGQYGITLNRGAAAQPGVPAMTTTTLTAAAGGTGPATLEAVEPTDITIDWLKEHRPDLVEALTAEATDPEEDPAAAGYDPEKDKAEMSQPATVTALKALPGATPEFVIDSLEAKLTLPAATAKLNASLVKRLADAERRAELAAAGSGTDPVVSTKGKAAAGGTVTLSGTDPVKDWAASAELRAHFTKECGGDEDKARQVFLSAAMSCREHGEAYLDMLPASLR